MKDNSKTKTQLIAELKELRKRVSELEKTEHLYNLADSSLRDSEYRNRNIIESSLAGMHMYELKDDGRLIFTGANPAADRILGIDNSIYIGKTIEEAFPHLVETEIPEKYKQVAASGKTWHNGTIVVVSHSFDRQGDYGVIARIQDEYGIWSNWSDPYVVSMPKKISIFQYNSWLFNEEKKTC